MTSNQLTYWQNVERARNNLENERIAEITAKANSMNASTNYMNYLLNEALNPYKMQEMSASAYADRKNADTNYQRYLIEEYLKASEKFLNYAKGSHEIAAIGSDYLKAIGSMLGGSADAESLLALG